MRCRERKKGVYVRVGSSYRWSDAELIEELRRLSRGEAFDAQSMTDLDSEAFGFRAASESFSAVHIDYAQRGAPLRQSILDDRLEVENLGLLPGGLTVDENTDQYEPEVGTFLPRLRPARSVEDSRQIVQEEFVKWFDVSTTGPQEKAQVVAERIREVMVPLLRTR